MSEFFLALTVIPLFMILWLNGIVIYHLVRGTYREDKDITDEMIVGFAISFVLFLATLITLWELES